MLLVTAEELNIRHIDGRTPAQMCLAPDDVRHIYLHPGEHTILATFQYDTPRNTGWLGEVEGQPLKMTHRFEADHEYVAVYREHPYPRPSEGVAEVASNVRASDDRYYWTLEIVDVAEAAVRTEPELTQASAHTAWIKGTAKLSP